MAPNGKIIAYLDILRCPRSGTSLWVSGDELVSATGERYPVVNGKPILVQRVEDFHITAPADSVVSRNIPEFFMAPEIRALAGPKLHLGSGDVPSRDPQVLSMDVLPTSNADLVAEAEHLPFAQDSLSYIESGAVFEHLYDPIAAIAEIRRVLRPGATFRIDTAFMQGYHGFPGHYFNMTPQAVETFLVDDFDLVASVIPETGAPTHSIDNSLRRLLETMPREERSRIEQGSVADFLAMLRDPTEAHRLNRHLTEHVRRSLASSVLVVGAKPEAYAERRAALVEEFGEPDYARTKRNYYSKRVAVIQRFGEVEFYRDKSIELGGAADGPQVPLPLDRLLDLARVIDTLGMSAWLEATRTLAEQERELTSIRDEWIRRFLVQTEIARSSLPREQESGEAR